MRQPTDSTYLPTALSTAAWEPDEPVTDAAVSPTDAEATPLAAAAAVTAADVDEADVAVGGPAARADNDVTGAGIKIGILSDSFNVTGRRGQRHRRRAAAARERYPHPGRRAGRQHR